MMIITTWYMNGHLYRGNMRQLQYIVPEPKLEVVPPDVGAIVLSKPDRYQSSGNQHHWTSIYVWNTIIPLVLNSLEVSFNPTDFGTVCNVVNGEDFSYHLPIIDDTYIVKIWQSTEHIDVFTTSNAGLHADYNQNTCISPYHALFIGAHKTCIIENQTTTSNRCLLLNCDSMAIPLVPILSHFFRKIVHLDSRDYMDCRLPNLFAWHEITDYVALFTSMSWCVYGKPARQLHPYIKSNT